MKAGSIFAALYDVSETMTVTSFEDGLLTGTIAVGDRTTTHTDSKAVGHDQPQSALID